MISYPGSPIYAVSVSVPDGSDDDDAASVSVGLEQLADRTAYLKDRIDGGLGFEFTDAILHGDTTFPDGTIVANVDSISLTAGDTSVSISAATSVSIGAFSGTAFFGGNDVSIGSSTSVTIAGTSFNLMSGKITVSSSLIVLGDDVNLGASTADAILAVGTFQANHNSIFVTGKTHALHGTVNVDEDLRAVVSSATGITYSSAGRAHYRDRLMVDADWSGGPFAMHPDVADIFYVTSLSGTGTTKVDTGGTSVRGDTIEVSTLGMTGGFNLEIYAADEVTLLLTMTATTNSWAKLHRIAGGTWRVMAVSDG
jgi:hypothetical protein